MIKILIVDDDALFGHMVKERLERDIESQQAVVIRFTSAEDAMEWMEHSEHQADIALVDNRLSSGKNGLEFLEWLRKCEFDIDSVLFTGLDEPTVGIRAYEAGAFRYLVKPFDPNELVWIVSSIIQKRATRYERNWLATLNEIGAAVQQALTTEMVAQTLVEGALKLGFERARIYRVVDPRTRTYIRQKAPVTYFQGYCQLGAPAINNFTSMKMPYEESVYVRRIYDEHHLKIFYGKVEGGYRLQNTDATDPYPPLGEWVGIPLTSGDTCSAILLMDNPSQKKVLHIEERALLALFAQQTSAAWERSVISEQRQQQQNANAFVRSIIDKTSHDGNPNNLQKLLEEVFRLVNGIVPTRNFVVALKHHDDEIDEKGWLYYCFHVQDGKLTQPYWRPPQERSFIRYVIDYERGALYFPETTLDYREEHGIRHPSHIVKSTIAIPLVVGNETIGGVFVEEFDKEDCWSQDMVELTCRIIENLAHYLQSAWINHQRIQQNKQLELVQSAGEKIMALAQQQPAGLPENEWLWHATLALATVKYGFSFNRALLFMVEEGESVLQGRMGIGHLEETIAQKAWERDERNGLDRFDTYIERLVSRDLDTSTPADQRVRRLRFPKEESIAFTQIIATKRRVDVPKQEAVRLLPSSFIQQFGANDYWLVPANAGNHLIGIIVLDTFYETEPPQTFALKYFNTLTNEVALIHENLRRSRAQRELLDVSRSTINFAYQLPLANSLRKIANVTRLVTGADTVSIYPLRIGSNPLQIDTECITWHPSSRGEILPKEINKPTRFMQYVLDTGRPLTVNDVSETHPSGINFAQDEIIVTKGIQSFICVPIRDYYTRRIDGLLYLNYRWRCDFSDEEVQQAEAFANLLSMTLRSWHEHHDLIIERDTRDEELQNSLEILQTALLPEIMEKEFILTLLNKARELFLTYDSQAEVNLGFSLLRWIRFDAEGAEPQKRFHQHFLGQTGNYYVKEAEKIKSLSGHAMQEGHIVRVADVRQRPWKDIYSQRSVETRSEIDIPLVGEDGRPMGVLNAESPQIGYFTETHENMLQRIARIGTLGLDSIARRQSMRALLSAGEEITKPTDLHQTLEVVSREVKAIVPSLSLMTIWYIDSAKERLMLGSSAGVLDPQALHKEYPRPSGAVRAVMQRSQPLWASDVFEFDFFSSSKFVQRENIKSTVAFPLTISGTTIGAVFFSYRHRHYFTRMEREFLPILAQYIASGVYSTYSFEVVNREKNRLHSLLQMTDAVSDTFDFQQVIEKTRSILYTFFPDAKFEILSYNRHKRALEISSDSGYFHILNGTRYQQQKDLPVEYIQQVREIVLNSEKTKEQHSKLISGMEMTDSVPYLSLPNSEDPVKLRKSQIWVTYVSKNRGLLGALAIERDQDKGMLRDEDLALAEGIAHHLGFALERSQQIAAIDFRNVVTDSMMWAADLAHDLNREIYHIRSWLQTLREESALSDDGYEAVNQIEESFNIIVQDVPWTTQKRVQILNLAEEISMWLSEFVSQHKVAVVIAANTKPICIAIPPQILKRAIRYLTRNALKAMNYRGTITVCTDYLDAEESTVRIQINDSGPGIKNDNPVRARVFREPLDENGSGGLGLLFARLHVEKLNGSIHLIKYEEGSGATFCIDLPVTDSGE